MVYSRTFFLKVYLDCLDSLDSIASSVQVHLPEAGTSLSFFGEDPQSRVSKKTQSSSQHAMVLKINFAMFY